jgi:basic membrane protein A
MKKICLSFVLLASLGLAACKPKAQSRDHGFRVALVLDKGGIDDKSFNSSAFEGATRAQKELGIELKHVEVTDDAQIEPTLKTFAKKDFDLVLSIGFSQQTAVKKTAEAFPNKHFAIVDAVVDAPNVASLMFQEHEGSFLAGALAALKSKTNVVGFVGGMDNPLIRRFEVGYREGALKVRPKIKVLVNYVGTSGDAWNNPTKAKELALSQIAQGADIIYHAAGASGLGVFDAVEESAQKRKKEVYAIGVDSNQNWVKPGLILTSMLKRVDNAVFETIKAAQAGRFVSGRIVFGLQNAGIDLAMDKYNEKLIDSVQLKEISKLRDQIQKSEIQVSDYYKSKGINP